MGMYDYLGGEQIKIFYNPIFEEENIETGKPSTWHSGGSLRSFDKNDELPLQTLYYKYPKNFCVFDYRGYSDVFIIKDGKFKEIKKYYNLKKSDLGDAVFNYYGNKININHLKDFKEIKDDFENTMKAYDEGKKQLFPDGFYETMCNNMPLFKEKESELEALREKTFDVFSKKWSTVDEYEKEKQLGEFLDSYIVLKSLKDGDIYSWSNPMLRYLKCKEATKNYINENPDIVEKYLAWVDNPDIIDKTKIHELVTEIFKDPSPDEIARSQEEPLDKKNKK